jgi:hypothetical protein
MQTTYVGYLSAIAICKKAQTIIFAAEQAQVFAGISKTYTDSLEYRLPFENVLLHFDAPIPHSSYDFGSGDRVDGSIISLLLTQTEVTEDSWEKTPPPAHPSSVIKKMTPKFENGIAIVNTVVAIWEDSAITRIGWQSVDHNEFMQNTIGEFDVHEQITQGWRFIKSLAIACIGYINCENVYLHKEGQVDPAVNRKRERKGKAKLEPYYICRIRGVNYDSESTGTGAKHGHRYDVRGHFRRLDSGKVTWVRPHQRGVHNELYIPKVYKVD